LTDWHRVASLDALDPEEPLIVTVGDHVIAVYSVDGGVFATAGTCTHEAECLEGGYVEDGTVECPYHSAVFNIRSGEKVGGPDCDPLATYPVKLDGNEISVDLAGKKVAG
jgi:nitrite reductase/ring-hydroxylating ferredoxin subunit